MGQQTDYQLPGAGEAIAVSRTYNSISTALSGTTGKLVERPQGESTKSWDSLEEALVFVVEKLWPVRNKLEQY